MATSTLIYCAIAFAVVWFAKKSGVKIQVPALPSQPSEPVAPAGLEQLLATLLPQILRDVLPPILQDHGLKPAAPDIEVQRQPDGKVVITGLPAGN